MTEREIEVATEYKPVMIHEGEVEEMIPECESIRARPLYVEDAKGRFEFNRLYVGPQVSLSSLDIKEIYQPRIDA